MLIGEVAARTGISARMLRHYDRVGVVKPSERNSSGYRVYTAEDMRRLVEVEGLRSLGVTLSEVSTALASDRIPYEDLISVLLNRARCQLTRAHELVERLESVQTARPTALQDVMRTIGLLRGFDGGDPSMRQRHALSVLTDDHRDTHVLVDAALREEDPNAFGAIQWVIVRSGDAAVAQLTTALDDEKPDRRYRALKVLEKIKSSRSRAAISEAVNHPDRRIRLRAHLERADQGNADSIPYLVEYVAAGDADMEAGEALERCATTYGLAAAVVEAIGQALDTADPAGRRRLAASLSLIPGPSASWFLSELADDNDPSVSVVARGLRVLRHGAVPPPGGSTESGRAQDTT